MNTKHTPGPWETTRQSGITYIWQAGTENAIAKVYADVNEDSEANARLIAAAPEFLRVAELAATLNTQTNEIGMGMLAELVQRAQAAIAKATGETI